MHRWVSNRWQNVSNWLLCTIAMAALLWSGLVLETEALAQAQAPAGAPAPAAAPAAVGQSNGSSTIWLLLLLLLVIVVAVYLMMRSGRRTAPAVKKGDAARGWFDPAGSLRSKF